jgi:RHH-type transcriptional regulator, proline utilization regulon repressor / proline dehydrogenase / delta 1-pyrroline-5-carboxylate dehydrogenase
VLASGFDSSGQRCSALRVLCLQNDIAERVLKMLKAAMQELVIGDPARLSTDIGPVIDEEAREGLLAHIEHMRQNGKDVFQSALPAGCGTGFFVPPTLIEIDSLADLEREVFGPVVHVLRFDGGKLDSLIEAVNATGYGLTLGLHSRIDETAQRVTSNAHVGTIYINRNMVGAVVGVQPFGGEGLSGTGPKAGGPLYLHRLADSENVPPAELGGIAEASPLKGDSPFSRLTLWAFSSGRRDVVRLCSAYADLTLRFTRLDLPGPTGERNTLIFAPRGRMLCLAANAENLLSQFAAVFATGNVAVAVDDTLCRSVLGMLPEGLSRQIELRSATDLHGLAGVLHAGDDTQARVLRESLAEMPGALIPVFHAAGESGLYPLYRMMVERVICLNTAAAGGNMALMTLGA